MVLSCGRPDCVRRAPQTAIGSPHWIPSPTIGNNNGANVISPGYGNPKDFSTYQQQQQQPQPLQHQQQQQQPQQQSIQPQTAYSSHQYTIQPTAPKYEPAPFQSVNQPQYVYEGVYQAPLNSYSQSVLVPCLCPVNREVLEQQAQQLQQQTPISITPTSSSFPADPNNNAAPLPSQTNQKRTAVDKTGNQSQVSN